MDEYGAEGTIKYRILNLGGIANKTLNLHGQPMGHYPTMDLKAHGDIITLLGNDYILIYGEEEAFPNILFLGLLKDILLVILGSASMDCFYKIKDS